MSLKKIIPLFASISKDETRYFLNGVNFRPFESNLIVESTNGRILTMDKLTDINNEFDSFILKPLLLEVLAKNKNNFEINFYDSKGFKIIEFNKITLFIKEIEGEFPQIPKLLNSLSNDHSISIDRIKFINTLKKVKKVVKTYKFDGVLFEFENEILKIKNKNKEDKIQYINEFGTFNNIPNGQFLLNPDYLINLLKTIKDDNFILEFNYSGSPIVIKIKDNKEFLFLVQPLRD